MQTNIKNKMIETEYDSINEFTVAGDFGFHRVEGPFECVKDGTVWGIVVPEDTHASIKYLDEQVGEAAVIIADGETVGGGILTDVIEVAEHGELHVLIDQYLLGNTSTEADNDK